MGTALMTILLALLAISAQPSLTPPPPAADEPRFGGLFIDWREANRESLDREHERAIAADVPARSVAEAEALGDRVGRVVAEGACAEGERIAREAGDFALVRAVQDHCRRVPAEQLPAWAQPPR